MKKIINTNGKLGTYTVLLDSMARDYISMYLGGGTQYGINNLQQYGAVIVYYSLISNDYYNQFYIPRELYGKFFYDTHSQGAIYLRLIDNKLDISSQSSGHAKVLGIKLIY